MLEVALPIMRTQAEYTSFVADGFSGNLPGLLASAVKCMWLPLRAIITFGGATQLRCCGGTWPCWADEMVSFPEF